MEQKDFTVKELKEILSMLDESYDNKFVKVGVPPDKPTGFYPLAMLALPNDEYVRIFPQEKY